MFPQQFQQTKIYINNYNITVFIDLESDPILIQLLWPAFSWGELGKISDAVMK